MLFNSSIFILFLIPFFIIYFLVPQLWRKYVLLGASLLFYAYFSVKLLLLLCVSCFIAYAGARLLDNLQAPKKRKLIVIGLTLFLLSILGYFKYAGFFASILNDLLAFTNNDWRLPIIKVALPLGISFYTFQLLGYLFDVYKKEIPAEKNFLILLLFKLFFPQLIAGPIERAHRLLPQLKNLQSPDYSTCVSGFLLITWGYVQKVVIADNLAFFVDRIFDNSSSFNGVGHAFALLSFSMQIFFDFSGYIDIARGIARILNINLSVNFRFPYISQSITEFWIRWNITLSEWFRDYLFFPIAFGTKIKIPIWLLVIFVFTVSGLWHGPNWTFIVWGLLHGTYISIEQNALVKNIQTKLPPWIRVIFTFCLICFAWLFFRSDSIAAAFLFLKSLFGTWSLSKVEADLISTLSINIILLKTLVALIAGLIISFRAHKLLPLIPKNNLSRLLLSIFLIYVMLFFGEFNEEKFIYFQF